MKKLRSTFVAALAVAALSANADIPLKILNNTHGDFDNSEIYVGILGQIKTNYIYYDMVASAQQKKAVLKTLDESANTIHEKDGDWGYADFMTKLSDIPEQTIYIGDTFACRMFIAFKSPMYLHAFGNGYAGADMNNPNDPNAKVRWELIEFTYEPQMYDGQIWINHTRVDAFQYPMGLELYGSGTRDGSVPYTKRGEFVDYGTVINKWNDTYASTAYKDCYYNLIERDNLGGIIKQPSKVESVKHAKLFDGYIEKIWSYFTTHDANIDMGILGRWTGRVQGSAFVMTCAEGTYWQPGSVATVERPTTEDAIEGAGPFAQGTDVDKTVQTFFCAAFNRGQFRAQTELQVWDPEKGIKPFEGGTEYPCNEYVKFFHSTDISVSDGKTYAFSYDDTYDQSATCYTTSPTGVTVTIGGFANNGGTGVIDPNPTPNPNPDPQPDPDPQPSDMPAAPVPDKAATQVKSVFSDSYTSITPGLAMGSWGQSTTGEVVSIDGNNTYKFANFNYLGLQVSAQNDVVDVKDMKYIHLDLYAESDMSLNFFPISLNPTVDSAQTPLQLTGGEWKSFDLPMSDYAAVDFTKFGQVKFDGGSGQTFYLDNLYFWTDGSVTPIEPDPIDPDPIDPDPIDTPSAAPAPAHDQSIVMSFFSDAYSSIVPDMFVGTWGQATIHEYVDCGGDQALKLTNFNYLGLQFSHTDDVVGLPKMTHLHVDLYATHPMTVEIYPISLGPTVDTNKWTHAVTPGEWNSLNIPLAEFPNVDFTKLGQFKFVNVTPAAAPARALAPDASNPALYLDNLYAWSNSTVGIDTVSTAAETSRPGVYDLFGRKLREDNSLDGLPRGLYLVGGRKVAVTR